jgi:formylmethanofuran dehydrogenase subunit E
MEKKCEKCGRDISENRVRLVSDKKDLCLHCYLERLDKDDKENVKE